MAVALQLHGEPEGLPRSGDARVVILESGERLPANFFFLSRRYVAQRALRDLRLQLECITVSARLEELLPSIADLQARISLRMRMSRRLTMMPAVFGCRFPAHCGIAK